MNHITIAPSHATVNLQPPRRIFWTGTGIPVDKRLAPAIEACWALGIRTTSCCQNDGTIGGVAVVAFFHHSDLLAFLAAILEGAGEDDDIRQRLRDWDVAEPQPSRSRKAWHIITVPCEYGPYLGLYGEVRFPPSDIGEVTQRLQAAVERKGAAAGERRRKRPAPRRRRPGDRAGPCGQLPPRLD